MTQHDYMISLFRMHGGSMTLGQIMKTTLAAEYRARMTDLRKHGYLFILQRGKTASENRYQMLEPNDNQTRLAI